MAYCMYLRKSRADLEAEARGEGETLSRHLHTLLQLAERLHIDVAPGAIYKEIVSGDTIAARPMMQRLLQEVQDGKWEGVLCTEVERLARGDTIDQGLVAQAFKYSGTRIITPAKTYDPENEMDEEYFEFSLFMARREYKTIKRRMQAGRAASVREGHYVGGRRPYGYQVVKCADGKGYTLRQIPEEAAIVRKAYDWYLYEGVGAAEIANRLNARGALTTFGHTFDAGRVRRLLDLPIYAGFVQWYAKEGKTKIVNGRRATVRSVSDRHILVKGLHEPIISADEYEQCQARFASRRTIPKVQKDHIANPLAGLIKCGLCGYGLTRRPNRQDVFYVCRNPMCSCSSARCDVVLAMVLDTLRGYVSQYSGAVPAADPRGRRDHAGDIAALESSVQATRRQLISAQDMLERGVYSIEEYLARKETLSEKIKSAEDEIAHLRSLDAAGDQETAILRNLPKIRSVLDAWPFATTAKEQNDLLRSLLSRVDYTKTQRLQRNDNPLDHITLTLHFL